MANYTRFRIRIPFGDRRLQRHIYVQEGKPNVYFGYVTRYDKVTVKFVWDTRKYETPWIFGVDKRASSCDPLRAAVIAAVKMFVEPQLSSGASFISERRLAA